MTLTEQQLQLGRFIPAMITPFKADLSLDIQAALELAVQLIADGADDLVICGTTGEGPTLTVKEKLLLFKGVKSALGLLKNDTPVIPAQAGIHSTQTRTPKLIANIGSNSTADTIDLLKVVQSQELADAVLVVVPYYNKPPQEGLYAHFAAINDASRLPIIIYNIPSRTGINLEAATTIKLAQDCEYIAGIKEASGDMQQIKEIITQTDNLPRFKVWAGNDDQTLDVIEAGGHGVISTIGNIAPAQISSMIVQAVAGDVDSSRALEQQFWPAIKGLFTTTNPILLKAAFELMGKNYGKLRLPLVSATPEQKDILLDILESTEILQHDRK